MKQLKPLLLHFGLLALCFYLLPLLIADTGSGMLILLLVLPLLTLISGLLFSIRHGFSILHPLAAGLLFLPVPFLYFNDSALVYAPIYAGISLLGTAIGWLFHRKRSNQEDPS